MKPNLLPLNPLKGALPQVILNPYLCAGSPACTAFGRQAFKGTERSDFTTSISHSWCEGVKKDRAMEIMFLENNRIII